VVVVKLEYAIHSDVVNHVLLVAYFDYIGVESIDRFGSNMNMLNITKVHISRFIRVTSEEGFDRALTLALRYLLGRLLQYYTRSKVFVRELRLRLSPNEREHARMDRIVRAVKGYTVLSEPRLINLYKLAKEVDELSLPGDIVECGVFNGGSAATIAAACLKSHRKRNIWLFDSFQGLPKPSDEDGTIAQSKFHEGWCSGDTFTVREIFQTLGVPESRVRIVSGWFQDTFPSIEIQPIALLHIDADWYESVKLCLEKFYDNVCRGGFIILDDYGRWEGCRRATDEFLIKRQLNIRLNGVDVSHYFQKP
jgi:hypothetical protein